MGWLVTILVLLLVLSVPGVLLYFIAPLLVFAAPGKFFSGLIALIGLVLIALAILFWDDPYEKSRGNKNQAVQGIAGLVLLGIGAIIFLIA